MKRSQGWEARGFIPRLSPQLSFPFSTSSHAVVYTRSLSRCSKHFHIKVLCSLNSAINGRRILKSLGGNWNNGFNPGYFSILRSVCFWLLIRLEKVGVPAHIKRFPKPFCQSSAKIIQISRHVITDSIETKLSVGLLLAGSKRCRALSLCHGLTSLTALSEQICRNPAPYTHNTHSGVIITLDNIGYAWLLPAELTLWLSHVTGFRGSHWPVPVPSTGLGDVWGEVLSV